MPQRTSNSAWEVLPPKIGEIEKLASVADQGAVFRVNGVDRKPGFAKERGVEKAFHDDDMDILFPAMLGEPECLSLGILVIFGTIVIP